METIKFRANIKGTKEIYDISVIDFESEQVYIVADFVDNQYCFGSVNLMQFTGLKDKNGTEIYEGDVVYDQNRGHPIYYEVKYGECELNPDDLGFTTKIVGFYLKVGENYFEDLDGIEYSEIIGNIYQDNNLLK